MAAIAKLRVAPTPETNTNEIQGAIVRPSFAVRRIRPNSETASTRWPAASRGGNVAKA